MESNNTIKTLYIIPVVLIFALAIGMSLASQNYIFPSVTFLVSIIGISFLKKRLTSVTDTILSKYHTVSKRFLWSNTYTRICIGFTVAVIIIFSIYFRSLMLNAGWLLAAITIVAFFSIGANYVYGRWASLPDKQFAIALVFWSIFLRFFVILILYMVFNHFTGAPFEVGVGFDDHTYHSLADSMAKGWKAGKFGVSNYIPNMGFGYYGYPTFSAILYYFFFSSTILARIINAILGGFTVLLAYKICKGLWGEEIGRTCGVLSMFFPFMLYYSSTQHKDSLLTFLVLFVIHLVLKQDYSGVKKGIKLWELVLILGIISVLFTFRLIIPVLLLLCIFIYQSIRMTSFYVRVLNICGAILGMMICFKILGLLAMIDITMLFDILLAQKEGSAEYQGQWALAGSSLFALASVPLFLAIVLPAPFPLLVNLPLDTTSAPIRTGLYHIGSSFVWNVLSFFALIGFYYFIKKKFKTAFPIWCFTLIYLCALASSSDPTADRHKLVIFPFLMMFTAVGLHQKMRYKKILLILYLIGIFVVIFGFNYIRLAGRGMI